MLATMLGGASGLHLRCSHRYIARFRAGHCWSPFPACPELIFTLCLSAQKLLKANGGPTLSTPRSPIEERA